LSNNIYVLFKCLYVHFRNDDANNKNDAAYFGPVIYPTVALHNNNCLNCLYNISIVVSNLFCFCVWVIHTCKGRTACCQLCNNNVGKP